MVVRNEGHAAIRLSYTVINGRRSRHEFTLAEHYEHIGRSRNESLHNTLILGGNTQVMALVTDYISRITARCFCWHWLSLP